MRAKGLGLVRHGLEKLRTESELLVLGLDKPYEISVRIEGEVIKVAELRRGQAGEDLHHRGPLLLHEPEEGEGRVPGPAWERGIVEVRSLDERRGVTADAPVVAPAESAQDEWFATLALRKGDQVVPQCWEGGGHDGWEIVPCDHLVRGGSQRRGDTDDEVEVCWRIGEERRPGRRAVLGAPCAKKTCEG